MADQGFVIEDVDGIAELRLDRPPVNALDLETTERLVDALAALEASPDVHAVVLTGTGTTFCAGLDLKALARYTTAEQDRFLDAINRVLYRLYGFPKPVVAAVNGSAVAGGLALVLASDYRMGIDVSAKLAFSEVQVGVPYPIAVCEIARGELSPPTARLLMQTGAVFGTKTAVARGILDETEPPSRLLAYALARAADLAAMPAATYALIKRQQRWRALEQIRRAAEEGEEPLKGAWIAPAIQAALGRSSRARN